MIGKLRRGFLVIGSGVVLLVAVTVRALPAVAEESDPQAANADDELLFEEFEAEQEDSIAELSDPLEKVNRVVFKFNCGVDDWLFEPVTRVYAFVVPSPARSAVHDFFNNLNSPEVMVNDLLQMEWKDAGITTARFCVNTTIGIGGLFDPAVSMGMEGHYSDFGQTLALAGVPSGPYLMFPIFGPTTPRDGLGALAGIFFRPATYLLGPGGLLYYNTIHGSSRGVVEREQNAQGIRVLKESSIDYYAAMRSAYNQSRSAAIWRRRNKKNSTEETSPSPAELEVSMAHSPLLQ